VTVLTTAVVSFHPTTTTLRLPAVCAAVYVTDTAVCGDCGVAKLRWTNVIAALAGAATRPTRNTAKAQKRERLRRRERANADFSPGTEVARRESLKAPPFAQLRRHRNRSRPFTPSDWALCSSNGANYPLTSRSTPGERSCSSFLRISRQPDQWSPSKKSMQF